MENMQSHTHEFLHGSQAGLLTNDRNRSSSMIKSYKDLDRELAREKRTWSDAEKEKTASGFTNYENSIHTGIYSTSYNKTVDDITSGRVKPRPVGTVEMLQPGVSVPGTAMPTPLMFSLSTATDDATIRHLLVKQDALRASLEQVLNDHPKGECSDTILRVLARSPHISMVVDQPISLKPGAELFTLMLGHPKPVGILK
jgi:hypothetical protein